MDSFGTAELKPLVPVFLKGAYIVYAHSVLSRQCGLGYTSQWAKSNFKNTAEKNEFFRTLGEKLTPGREDKLGGVNENILPRKIMDII